LSRSIARPVTVRRPAGSTEREREPYGAPPLELDLEQPRADGATLPDQLLGAEVVVREVVPLLAIVAERARTRMDHSVSSISLRRIS
jgi:hypothetical protein